MTKLIYENLKASILDKSKEFEELLVISGYISPSIIHEISDNFRKLTVIYGMYGLEGISPNVHNALLKLNKKENIEIFYSTIGTHSKSYFFINKGEVKELMIGSANFSSNGLERDKYQEILFHAEKFNEHEIRSYIDYIIDSSVKCDEVNIENKVKKQKKLNQLTTLMPLYLVNKDTKIKYVPERSGLNWGNQKGYSRKADLPIESYIRISAKHIDEFPLLFPPIPIEKKSNEGKGNVDPIELIWDDGVVMKCNLSGRGVKREGRVFPKQITSTSTPLGNSELGKYIRERMGLNPRAIITYDNLKQYGRDNIELTYLQEGTYLANFAVDK